MKTSANNMLFKKKSCKNMHLFKKKYIFHTYRKKYQKYIHDNVNWL